MQEHCTLRSLAGWARGVAPLATADGASLTVMHLLSFRRRRIARGLRWRKTLRFSAVQRLGIPGYACCSHKKTENSQEEDNNMLGLWAAVATIATVFVYIAQAYLMRETMVHTNRAYVHIGTWEQHPNSIGKDDMVDVWRIAPHVENTGNTPTRNLVYSIVIVTSDAELPTGFRFITEGQEKRTLLWPRQYFLPAELIVKTVDLVMSKSNLVWYYMYGG